MTLEHFFATLIILGFKKISDNKYETKEFKIMKNMCQDTVFIHKKYLSKRPDKEFNDFSKALRHITKSLELDKDLF